jgi:hypothetical protein
MRGNAGHKNDRTILTSVKKAENKRKANEYGTRI